MKNKQEQNQDNSKNNLTNTDKSNKKDISNSLKNDAVGKFGSNNPTPQNRTDNEQGTEKRRDS